MQYALFYIDFFVNNIQKNHHLTALNGDFIIVCVTFLIMCFNRLSPFLRGRTGNSSQLTSMVSMPFIGLSPFLQGLSVCHQQKRGCVNALYRASSISTLYLQWQASFCLRCQCPLSGFFHFYRSSAQRKMWRSSCCVNALYRASSISTVLMDVSNSKQYIVSMPFIGLLPFLLLARHGIDKTRLACQCPLSGFFHFYIN